MWDDRREWVLESPLPAPESATDDSRQAETGSGVSSRTRLPLANGSVPAPIVYVLRKWAALVHERPIVITVIPLGKSIDRFALDAGLLPVGLFSLCAAGH